MGITEILKNWLEERRAKSEKRRIDKQELRLKKIDAKNKQAEQVKLLKEAKIKANEAIKIKKLEAQIEKSKLNALRPGFFESLSALWEKRGERRKAIRLAKIEKNKAIKTANASKPSLIEKISKYLNERGERRKAIRLANVDRPTFWDKVFNLLKPKTPAMPSTITTPTKSVVHKRSRIGSYSLFFMLICFAVVYYKYKQQPTKQEQTSVIIDGEVEQSRLTSIDNSNGHLHHSSKKIKIGEGGYLYERTPGWTYWESTEDHLIYIPNGTNEKYFKGPNGWESEYPNKGTVRALTRPTDEILVYPNKNYGGSKFTLKIIKIAPQSAQI